MNKLWKKADIFSKYGSIDDILRAAAGKTAELGTPKKDKGWFDALKTKSSDELKGMGLKEWEKEHWLYPQEWYDFIPESYTIITIFDDEEPFIHGETDDDQRAGMLAYGFTTKDD